MDLKLQLTQADSLGKIIDSQTIEIESGSRLSVDFASDLRILRDGDPPAVVAPFGNDLIIQWDDGAYLILEAVEGTFDPDTDTSREVSINGVLISGFGNDADQAQLDAFMQWGGDYADSPLPWAPLPPYATAFPEELEHLPVEETDAEIEIPLNSPPVVGDLDLRVSEEGLKGGIPDSAGSSDTTNASSVSGTLVISDPDGDSLTVTLTSPADGILSSNGNPVVWSGDGTSQLIGTAGGQVIITIKVDNGGNYSVELGGPLTHAVAGLEDETSFTVGVVVSDGGESTEAEIDVTVEDDSPVTDIETTGELEALVVDETYLGAAGATDTASYAGNFTVLSSAYGADQAGMIASTYELGITAG
ncbi:MAG: DUF5801 repeats-in-toxin domain-containing protein, partial [Verrucomicrobiales bacterium]